MKALIDLHYLPSLEYFSAIIHSNILIVEKHERYIKQSYRNRCWINTANEILKLVVPITSKHGRALVKDVKIDNTSKWQTLHWRAIKSAYGKAPYFEHYAHPLEKIMFNGHEFLFDLNFQLLSFCLQSLGLSLSLTESTSYEKVPSTDVKDLRSVIGAKIKYSERDFYKPTPYLQVFGNKFVPNLSLIDLLFCEGPNAIQILKSSTKGYLNN